MMDILTTYAGTGLNISLTELQELRPEEVETLHGRWIDILQKVYG